MNEQPQQSDAPATKPTKRHGDESIKETLESIVIAFILAFVFRAYVVEAFVIPTGSMAPTLLGEHIDVSCIQCGEKFTVDPPDDALVQQLQRQQGPMQWSQSIKRPYLTTPLRAHCPMCHYPNLLPERTRLRPGDRILVHKYIYSFSEPRRWDVVVFKNPQEPQVNFIKRLVGLPNERLWIIEGNVYVQPLAPANAAWQIARKTDRPQVQNAVWQPIYHSTRVPLDGGGPSLARRGEHVGGDHVWRVPWVPNEPDDWLTAQRSSYQYSGTRQSWLRFDFQNIIDAGPGWYAYNQIKQPGGDDMAIEDIRLAAAFQPEQVGLSVTMTTTARLDDPNPESPPQPIGAHIAANGGAELFTIDPQTGNRTVLQAGQVGAFTPGIARDVEFWFVDQQASLWVDGQQALTWNFELDIDTLVQRPALSHQPRINIGVEGSPVTLHRVQLDRDLYYTASQRGSQSGWGTLYKATRGRQDYRGEPVTLLNDRFFCLGDNSPMSSDGRHWDRVDPWVRSRLMGDESQSEGVVPRELMMGRAFFVYWPAPHNWRPDSRGIFPNFGDMRFIR